MLAPSVLYSSFIPGIFGKLFVIDVLANVLSVDDSWMEVLVVLLTPSVLMVLDPKVKLLAEFSTAVELFDVIL